jgi:hypothetical protein
MNRYEKYMNDPKIINEPMPMCEIHAIRLMIHDDIKDMSQQSERPITAKDSTKCGGNIILSSSAMPDVNKKAECVQPFQMPYLIWLKP